MNIRRGEVHEVTSFYSFLQVPVDVTRVCRGPVCDCMGADATGALPVECVGHCDLAPVRMQGDEIVGGVTHRTNSWLIGAGRAPSPRPSCRRTRCSRGSRRPG